MALGWRWKRLAAPLLALIAAISLAACVGPDQRQARLCERLAGAFHDQARITDVLTSLEPDGRILTRYRVDDNRHWIACRFAGGAFDQGRGEIIEVATNERGALSPVKLHLLRLWAGLGGHHFPTAAPKGEAPPRPPPAAPWLRETLFIAQQLVNGASVASVYGLLAIGYTLVFGVLRQVNLAMGELTMIGAMVAAMASALLAMFGWGGMPLGLLAVLALAMAVPGLCGWTLDRVALRRVHRHSGHAPLIMTVGVALATQEAMRLLHGAREWWPTPPFSHPHALIGAGDFTVTAVTAQLVVVWITAALYLALAWVMGATALGRSYRACRDDIDMAAMMGVDTDRVIAVTVALGGACAGAAGCVIALRYGGVNFFTGYQVGFKALTAAIIGGIGSVPGAMLGGVALATVETLWQAYFPIAYKDVMTFGLLAAFLIYRPGGLMNED